MISKDEMKLHTWDERPKAAPDQGEAFTADGRTDPEQARNVPASCKAAETAEHDYADDLDNESYDDDDGWLDQECALGNDGQCGLAGTEHCDFECPYRDSEDFAGSEAWRKKHERAARSPAPPFAGCRP